MSDQNERDEKPEVENRSEFGKSTRRSFLSRLGMASLLATAGPAVTTLAQRAGKVEQMTSSESKDAIPVTLTVNGTNHDVRIDPRTTLLD
jgi:xanthine dehydrogenase YagT iron-sulfur-binding subunit